MSSGIVILTQFLSGHNRMVVQYSRLVNKGYTQEMNLETDKVLEMVRQAFPVLKVLLGNIDNNYPQQLLLFNQDWA